MQAPGVTTPPPSSLSSLFDVEPSHSLVNALPGPFGSWPESDATVVTYSGFY